LLKVKAQLSLEHQRIFVYEHVRSGDLFHILDPNLQLDQLEEVQRDVAQLLEHGLNPPAPPQPATASERDNNRGSESQPSEGEAAPANSTSME